MYVNSYTVSFLNWPYLRIVRTVFVHFFWWMFIRSVIVYFFNFTPIQFPWTLLTWPTVLVFWWCWIRLCASLVALQCPLLVTQCWLAVLGLLLSCNV
jgi:hypothetical protein